MFFTDEAQNYFFLLLRCEMFAISATYVIGCYSRGICTSFLIVLVLIRHLFGLYRELRLTWSTATLYSAELWHTSAFRALELHKSLVGKGFITNQLLLIILVTTTPSLALLIKL